MEISKICSSDVVQFPLHQMMTREIIEELTETVVKHELPEEINEGFAGLVDEITPYVDCYGSEQYFNKPTFEIQQNVIIVKQNDCDSGDEFMDTGTPQSEAHIANECKEEEIDIKHEDLETEALIDWRHDGETFRRKESSKKPKQAGSPRHKLGLVCEAESEVYLYKCQECSYAAKQAGNLIKHMLLHQDKSEGDSYRCHECSYTAKRAANLTRHMLRHKPKSEVDSYKCHECSYAAKRADYLKNHILVHKAKSEVDLYKCKKCSFATKRATSIKRHMLVHKTETEVVLHKCHECSYTANRAGNLKRHMVMHNTESEVDLYRCTECSYATKQAVNLKTHMLVHKDASEIDLRKCNNDLFASIYAVSLKRHVPQS